MLRSSNFSNNLIYMNKTNFMNSVGGSHALNAGLPGKELDGTYIAKVSILLRYRQDDREDE